MNNLKISTRIALLTAFSSVLLLLIAGIGLFGIRNTTGALHDNYEKRTVPTGHIAEIQARLLHNRLLIAASLVTPEQEEIAKNTAAIEANIETIGKRWEEYMAVPMDAEERTQADRFAQHRKVFVAEGLKPTTAALRANEIDQAKKWFFAKVREEEGGPRSPTATLVVPSIKTAGGQPWPRSILLPGWEAGPDMT